VPLNLFIDTNIYLSFFHLTSDDLEELKKLSVVLANGEICLFLPEQVMDEFRRNRDGKLADGLKRLREQRLNLQFPQICKDYPEFVELRRLQMEYEERHSALLEKLTRDIASYSLKADILVKELFDQATIIPTANQLDRARRRMDLGNPPGKAGSLGDAVNWEGLLEAVPKGEELNFVTDDRDFASPLDESTFDGFLMAEWTAKKLGGLLAYRRLSEFFKSKLPEIKLASEAEKDLLIGRLARSGTFATTHATVGKLSGYSEFSDAQANAIVAASLSNNQVTWILGDEDVKSLVNRVIAGREDRIDPESLEAVRSRIAEIEATEGDQDA
jgi:predicted nucleic acid-binding protein